jgi:hypothetical protein
MLRVQNVHRRLVYYISGYDPIRQRRYRELYRKQAARQATISGYTIQVLPIARIGSFGWRVVSEMTSQPVVNDFDVLQ